MITIIARQNNGTTQHTTQLGFFDFGHSTWIGQDTAVPSQLGVLLTPIWTLCLCLGHRCISDTQQPLNSTVKPIANKLHIAQIVIINAGQEHADGDGGAELDQGGGCAPAGQELVARGAGCVDEVSLRRNGCP